jgi:hypothetical protein
MPRSNPLNPAAAPQLPQEVAQRIGPYYVYLLRDPLHRNRPFYVGKGTGKRLLQHRLVAEKLTDKAMPRATTSRIQQIRDSGREPDIDVVRHHLDEDTAFAVEAALIDVLSDLTNSIRGQHTDVGLSSLKELVARYGAPPLKTKTPLLLIRLRPWADDVDRFGGGKGYGYRAGMSQRDLYRTTRQWWVISPDRVERDEVRHAVPVYEGVTRGLFTIRSWRQDAHRLGRWGFSGQAVLSGALFNEVVGPLGHRVPFTAHSQNPISYWLP